MSDLIFRAMLHMLLDGKDYSIAELVQEANLRYEMPPELAQRIRMILEKCGGSVQHLPNKKYRKLRDLCDIGQALQEMKSAPEGHFKGRPGMRRLYSEFQERYETMTSN